jgi:hypothetical protein
MAKLRGICPECGAAITVCVGQSIVQGRLVWSQGHCCATCGHAVEADGYGEPPADVVQALIAEEGRWELLIGSIAPSVSHVLAALRKALSLNLSQAAELKNRLPGPVTDGTKVHMAWLAHLLKLEGIDATVRQKLSASIDSTDCRS